MSATSHSLYDEYNVGNTEPSQSAEEIQDILKNDIVCISKDQLIKSFYQLHQDNILMNEQIKKYREITEFLESKMNNNNETNKKKQQQIYDTILKIKKLIQVGGSKNKLPHEHSKKRSKHLKHSKKFKHSKRSKRSKQKHSKRSKHSKCSKQSKRSRSKKDRN